MVNNPVGGTEGAAEKKSPPKQNRLGRGTRPLILHGDQACGIPLLDTTQIHVQAAVAKLIA